MLSTCFSCFVLATGVFYCGETANYEPHGERHGAVVTATGKPREETGTLPEKERKGAGG